MAPENLEIFISTAVESMRDLQKNHGALVSEARNQSDNLKRTTGEIERFNNDSIPKLSKIIGQNGDIKDSLKAIISDIKDLIKEKQDLHKVAVSAKGKYVDWLMKTGTLAIGITILIKLLI